MTTQKYDSTDAGTGASEGTATNGSTVSVTTSDRPSSTTYVTPATYDVGTGMSEAQDAEQNKVMGILAYIGILFLVPLFSAKESRFAMYHANQGLVLFLFSVITSTVGSVIPVVGWFLILPIAAIMSLVFAVMGIINAANGQMKPLPLIGNYQILK